MRLVVGMSGASGASLGYNMLKVLREMDDMEIHLIISESAKRTIHDEMGISVQDVEALADHVHPNSDIGALPASGSYVTDGMIVIPSSMKTISSIAHGYADNLITRAADVCMKENRKIVLVPREMPLSLLHLHNLTACAQYGCSIIPPMLTFYNQSLTVEDQIHHIIGKVLMQFGIPYKRFRAWDPESVNV